jgi:hypothetical protein
MLNHCAYRLNFNFFGLSIETFVETIDDVNILKANYRYFLETLEVDSSFKMWFTTEDMSGLFKSIFEKKKNMKYIYFSRNNQPIQQYCSFNEWSGVTSPFPPFLFEPLCNDYLYFQGSSVSLDDSSYCFLGNPFAGKSTTVNWILRNIRDSHYLSDDISILKIANLNLCPFPTTTAIRTECKRWFTNSAEAEIKEKTISEVTGLVEYYDVFELYGKSTGDTKPLRGIFILENLRNTGEGLRYNKVPPNERIDILHYYQLPFNNNSILFEKKSELSRIPMYVLTYDLMILEEMSFISQVLPLLSVLDHNH